MICKSCGQQTADDSRFCEHCGSIIENSDVTENAQPVQEAAPVETPAEPAQENVTAETPVEPAQESVTAETPVEPVQENVTAQQPVYGQTTPGYEQAASEPVYSSQTQKKPVDKAKIFAIGGIVVVLILVLMLLKACMGSGYEKPLNSLLKVANKQQTDIDKIAEAALPAPLANTYKEVMDVLESSDAYGDDIKDIKEDLPDALEDLYETVFDALEDEYGKNVKFSYEVLDEEKLDKSDRKDIQEAYQGLADIAPGLIACVEGLEDCTDLESKEIKKLVKSVESLEKELKNFKVSAAYELKVKLIVKGKDDDDSQKIKVVIIKANGEWMLDILSTAAINSDKDYDDLPDLIEDLELDDASDELEDAADMMEDLDEDIIETAIDALEEVVDALGDIESYLGSMLSGSMSTLEDLDDFYY